jgi:hypothetical protein
MDWILKYSLDDLEATPDHHNIFTFTLFLPEGRAGVAWEPSNKIMLFLPPRKIKCLSLHPLISSLNLLFIYPSHISLSASVPKVWDDKQLLGRLSIKKILKAIRRKHTKNLWTGFEPMTSVYERDKTVQFKVCCHSPGSADKSVSLHQFDLHYRRRYRDIQPSLHGDRTPFNIYNFQLSFLVSCRTKSHNRLFHARI